MKFRRIILWAAIIIGGYFLWKTIRAAKATADTVSYDVGAATTAAGEAVSNTFAYSPVTGPAYWLYKWWKGS